MSEMIERGIDTAIVDFKARFEAHSVRFGVSQTFGESGVTCPSRDTFRPMVVAVMEAMRVPTEAMIEAARGCYEESGSLVDGIYTVMIDEALK